MPCARCGGLVIENRADFVDDVGQRKLQGTRCVNCGAIDDPVIIANRVRPCHVRNDRPRRKVGVQVRMGGVTRRGKSKLRPFRILGRSIESPSDLV